MGFKITLTVKEQTKTIDVGSWRDHAAEKYGAIRRRLERAGIDKYSLAMTDDITGETLYQSINGVE